VARVDAGEAIAKSGEAMIQIAATHEHP